MYQGDRHRTKASNSFWIKQWTRVDNGGQSGKNKTADSIKQEALYGPDFILKCVKYYCEIPKQICNLDIACWQKCVWGEVGGE